MSAMPIRPRGHGTARAVATSIPLCTGRYGNRHSGNRNPRLLNPIERRSKKMSKLFFVNIPYNCSDRELQEWVESRGIETRSIRIVRDLVAGVSPAFGYVELKDESRIQEAIDILNGKRMRNQTILVKEAQVQATGAGRAVERKSA
jgi:RNA recognition motif-containing protein